MIQRSVRTLLRGTSRTKFADVVVRRRADELLRRPELHDGAVAHHHDPIAEAERLGQVVRDEHHRLAGLGLQSDHLVLHVAPDQGIERAEGLVEQQHLGIERERAGEADALLHASGELVGVLVLEAGQSDELDHLLCTRGPLRLGHALDLETERDVLDDAAVREQAEVLEDHRDGAAAQRTQLVGVGARDVAAGDRHLPGGRLDQAHEGAHERRLARARETHHDEHLAGPDLEADVANGRDASGLRAQLRAREIGVGRTDDLVGVGSEDLPDVLAP